MEEHHTESQTPTILEWLRGHPIVVDTSAMEALRQSLKRVVDSQKMHRAMHRDGMEWEVRQKAEEGSDLKLTNQLDMLCVVHPLTANEYNRKAKLVIEHRSEFPSKIRSAIEQAMGDNDGDDMVLDDDDAQGGLDSHTFLMEVYRAVKIFFLGRNEHFISHNFDGFLPEEWLGLNRDVDTDHQTETAIRFFPMILTEFLDSEVAVLSPIQLLLSQEKAVSFVPLFAELLTEAGEFLDRQFIVRHGLRNILELLLTNRFPTSLFGADVPESFDKESLSVLIRMREMGFVKNEEVRFLITSLMVLSFESQQLQRGNSFIETRMRLLINWNPSVLEDYGHSHRPLLHAIYDESIRSNCDENLLLCMFEILSELGMTHYPKELGFVFHKWGGTFPFHNFYSSLGTTERVAEIVNDKLLGAFGSNPNAFSSRVIAAATDDKIHLDGLFTLLSLNPLLLQLKSSVTISREHSMQSRQGIC